MLRRVRGAAAALLLGASVSSCFLAGALPDGSKKTVSHHPAAPGQPGTPVSPPPEKLAAARFVRRLALDLLQRLPEAADIAQLTGDPTSVPALVDGYLASAEAARSLASLHPRMWHLTPERLPDLDAYADAGDATLGAAMTPAFREALVAEPASLVRYSLDAKLPFDALFKTPFSIVSTDAVAFWNQSADGAPWAGEPYRFAAFTDGRPAGGLLVTNGWLAAFDSQSDPGLVHRTSRILHELTCLETETASAHLFYDLKPADWAGDLSTLALTRSPCVGCHAHFAQTAPAFAGLGLAADFNDWRAYQAPATAVKGTYGGHAFEGLAELATFVGEDPRTHRCEIEKLGTALLQRAFNDNDRVTAAQAQTLFYAGGLDLRQAVRAYLLSDEYAYGPVTPAVKGSYLRNSAGIRVLRREQWRGVLQQLSPATANLPIPSELDPGASETLTGEAFLPTGSYFHDADRLARAAASIIVDEELQAGSSAAARRVFTELPDGSGALATPDQVLRQLRALWARLTTEELKDTSPVYLSLQTLWAEAKPEASEDDFRRAWRVVLTAMLTHPTFLTY